jgi:penicillin-binding protein 1C
LNRYVEQQLREQLARLRALNATNGAAIVIDNATGDVLALVGIGKLLFARSWPVQWCDRPDVPRARPSSHSPTCSRSSAELRPATIYPDVPTEFRTPSGNYRVDNYQRRCSGPVTLRSALASSLNIPAVHALNSIGGPETLQRRLTDFGFITLDRPAAEYGLGLTLGNAEARLIDLPNAYATLARMGEFRPWRVFTDDAPHSGRWWRTRAIAG